MRADRVKPGMLVRRLESEWLVVTGPAEAAFSGWRIPLAGGANLPVMPHADVEAVRLTEAQARVLREVGAGNSYWERRRITDHGPTLWVGEKPVPFATKERLKELGLLAAKRVTDWQKRPASISPSGRALLDLLDREG